MDVIGRLLGGCLRFAARWGLIERLAFVATGGVNFDNVALLVFGGSESLQFPAIEVDVGYVVVCNAGLAAIIACARGWESGIRGITISAG